MQKEDGNKNALRSNARNQGQQIQPSRNIENRGVQDEIYCEDTIENGGHFLSFRTTGLSSALNPSGHSSLITFSTAQSFARAFPPGASASWCQELEQSMAFDRATRRARSEQMSPSCALRFLRADQPTPDSLCEPPA